MIEPDLFAPRKLGNLQAHYYQCLNEIIFVKNGSVHDALLLENPNNVKALTITHAAHHDRAQWGANS
jgi:hypothetical protein